MKKEEPPEPAQVDLFRLIKETEAKDFVLVISRQGQQWEVAFTDLSPKSSRTMAGKGRTFTDAWAGRKLEWS
jgi:hypothetical protein